MGKSITKERDAMRVRNFAYCLAREIEFFNYHHKKDLTEEIIIYLKKKQEENLKK